MPKIDATAAHANLQQCAAKPAAKAGRHGAEHLQASAWFSLHSLPPGRPPIGAKQEEGARTDRARLETSLSNLMATSGTILPHFRSVAMFLSDWELWGDQVDLCRRGRTRSEGGPRAVQGGVKGRSWSRLRSSDAH